MENLKVHTKITDQMQHMLKHSVIKNHRFLDDEQLIRSEQLAVLEKIFNANVRDAEIKELSSHFAPILRGDHPMHLALWGKTGTGKTLTMTFFLSLLTEMCESEKIAIRHVHLDLSTPRPCFRALNDLACLLNACKRYKRGISLEEIMLSIEASLADYRGYLVLFIDEADNVRRDKDTFLAFLIRRLPQSIPSKLILIFASNRLDWSDNLDPRVKSFLKLNELIFKPYDAIDLQKILSIRVEKALHPKAVEPGVVQKIAALASQDHGDARQAVALLAQSAYLAQKAACRISLEIVDQAAAEFEQDKYLTMMRTAPPQLQAAMAAVIQTAKQSKKASFALGDAYDPYKAFCRRADVRSVTLRAFRDLVAELDMYSFIRGRVVYKGRYGRSREIILELPEELVAKIENVIRLNFQIR